MADRVNINQLFDTVGVKNRIVDGMVRITFDGTQIEWAPGETKQMPRKHAEWFVAKSLYLFQSGDINEGESSKSHYKLCILGGGEDETDLLREDVLAVKELLDAQNMPHLTHVDPATGKAMRRVYIDPRSTGASDMAQRQAEESTTKRLSSAIVRDAAERIAEAAQDATEADIEAAVADLTMTAKG